ncbi:hypothetical protein RJ640_018959 [Escallonia rubra]|uniref:Cell growth-regulating nucleolar protein-like winged helix domain-containing protein n=1 Tax=Escallonia rubra TaxID=112253 RepID=A0AA88RSA3_9ASTE|nr:hypothetical protein RJ640_018959 [Escallonia rubra]
MAAHEAPLCYVGVARKSAAFRLMKQMQATEVKNHEDIEKDDDEGTKASVDNNETTVKATRPQGRYKKRERGKLVHAYSAKDLEGILVKKVQECPETDSNPDGPSELVDAFVSHDIDVEGNEEKEVSPDWWGSKYGFVSGGYLGAKARKKKSLSTDEAQNVNKRTAFHEEDQENLYKLVQDKATSGKQGLGIKDRTRKIAGVHFKGKKTSFSDSEDEDSTDSSTAKRKFGDMLQVEKGDESKLKLKKLCRKLLRQAPEESLKLKQLKVLIEEHSPSAFSHFCSKRDALAFLQQKLEGSSKFSLEGKMVCLSLKKG